jgi:hypothetical protein
MELLTSSRLRAYRACARQHLYAHVQGFRSVAESPALAFGTAVHEALSAWWGASRDLAFSAALAALPMTMHPFAYARATAMLAGYDAYWHDAGFVAVEIEREFRMPLINPETSYPSRTWELAGKVDAIVRAANGQAWVLEHKTSAEDISPGSPYRQRLALDGQVSQYVEGAAALGYDVDGVIYDVLAKPKHAQLLATPMDARKYTKPTKTEPSRLYAGQRDVDETVNEYRERVAAAIAEEPHRYYAAVSVVRLESERDDWRFDVWQLAELMRASARTGRAPRNPDACFRYGQQCPYWPVCVNEASLDDTQKYARVGANPELNEGSAT